MSFTTALSGINAQSEKLNVAGNNIANSQTVGYKSSSVRFADVFAGSQGIGVRVSDTRQDFTQGSVESTGRNLDLAISGDGFYRVERPSGEAAFSRSGEFSMTSDGFIVNAQGARLTGYGLDQNVDQAAVSRGEAMPFPFTDIVVGGAPQALQVPADDIPARQTSEVNGTYNFDSRVLPGEGLNQVSFNLVDDANEQVEVRLDYHYSNNYTTYDSLGNARQVSTYFEKLADNTWLATVAVDGQLIDGSDTPDDGRGSSFNPESGTPQSFLLNFNQNGQLLTKADIVAAAENNENITLPDMPNSAFDLLPDNTVLGITAVSPEFRFELDATNGRYVRNANALAANGDVGGITTNQQWITDFITDNGDVKSSSSANITIPGVQGALNPFSFDFNFAGSSQFANISLENEINQNGYTSGSLAGITVTADGVVMRNFTNEQSRPAGQIALANFRNTEGLEPLGNNLWAATNSSGLANLGVPGAGRFGLIESGAIEASNVELAKELVDMIISQRAYQANSNTISTQDELLQTIINL
ncbi:MULTISPECIES: flagellar hook protein FlgE [unclassified Halomonas]|uniref:flagellar hook protein FlgE n=1 Tax=unclassified Halomonas TaxID=2609666 RepID=UPI000990840C|nr:MULTISPECIES: flagellar hook protein FlgE [unclassified Halomonas]AQU84572.1 flagellar biosynthesis protein FlgE [Halomonas sp. 'Soap Lake \